MSKLLQAVQWIQQAALGLQPGTPLHKDALKAVTSLSRHLPAGAPTVGVQRTAGMDLLRAIGQSGFLQSIMGQRAAGAPGGQPPMPSTPLPGA
jgi:hypothetical protein